jgi:hypothetical protein
VAALGADGALWRTLLLLAGPASAAKSLNGKGQH